MASHNMNPADNRKVVQRFTEECWNQGKTNVVSEIVADNVRLHDPVFPHLTSGARNLRTHIETCRAAFPDIKFTVDDTICERNEVVNHWTAHGTHKGTFLGMPPTNRKAMITGTSIYRLENGKIAEQWVHWNLMSMMEQLGVAAGVAKMAATKTEKQPA
jgi:steroid delta-isomerase-like uncharacterized protein